MGTFPTTSMGECETDRISALCFAASPTQDCSKLGTTMGWKWFSRICERQHQVGPDQNVHSLPSRRLDHWRHHQRNSNEHTSRYTTTGPLPCKVHVELRRLTKQCVVCRNMWLPRQPAGASGASTSGSLGPFPFAHWGLWVPSPWCNTHAGSKVPLGHEWQLGLVLFGLPAREF